MLYKKIVIIDYKMGNLSSVYNAFKFLEIPIELSNSKQKIKNSSGIVLPGVGAFGDAMKNLEALRLVDILKNEIASGKPYLGICLGLQILFEKSEENKNVSGLSIFPGKVIKFKSKSIKIPHIGWNQILIKKRNRLLKNVKNNSFFYFVHSFYVKPSDSKIISTITSYGENFVSSVSKDNIYGVQFHPEKSQKEGLKIIKNFAQICFKLL